MNRLSKKMTRKSSEFELRKMHECKSSKKIRKEITNGGGCQRSLEPQLNTRYGTGRAWVAARRGHRDRRHSTILI